MYFANVNILLMGNGGSGKTTYAQRLCDKADFRFDPKYKASCGADKFSTVIQSNKGLIKISGTVLDGQADWSGIGAEHFANLDGAIILYDVGSTVSFRAVEFERELITNETNDNISIVVAGNKIDDTDNIKIKPKTIAKNRRSKTSMLTGLQDFRISIKTGENFLEPLQALMKLITGDDGIELSF